MWSRRGGCAFALVDHTREPRDAAGGGVGVKDALATGLLNRAGSGAQLRLGSGRIAAARRRHGLFHEGFDPRPDCLIAGVPFQVLFVSFFF